MSESSAAPLTLVSVLRQWPVACKIAEHLPAGSLIDLARSSTSLRGALHGFDVYTALVPCRTNEFGTSTIPDDTMQDVRSSNALHIGAHCTAYWEGLKRVAPFVCSSRTHTKGEKTRSCLYCSMPICESCVVKHSFGKKENTFKNRCRFMCQHCWNRDNDRKERRYRGRPGAADKISYKSAAEARNYCTCTSKHGWMCNHCKEKQNIDAGVKGMEICFGQNCDAVLEADKDLRKICLWCDKPIPRSRASIEARIAFSQRMMDARSRAMSWQVADYEEYESNRRGRIRMSRREMRGDEAVRDDPDADVLQFARNLDMFNYQALCGGQPTGEEVYSSKNGYWKYNSAFLMRFKFRCRFLGHRDAAFLQSVTSSYSSDSSPPKTNKDLFFHPHRQAALAEIEENPKAMLDPSSDANLEEAEETCSMKDEMPDADAGPHRPDASAESEEEEGTDDDFCMLEDSEIAEARMETGGQAGPDGSVSGTRIAELQPMERPPEYSADTLILEAGTPLGPTSLIDEPHGWTSVNQGN